MRAVIVVESCFGATLAAAEEIARGLRDSGMSAAVLAPREATPEAIGRAGLLVLGAPTHNRGLPTPGSRATAVKRGGRAEDPGLREWLTDARLPASARIAAFDTVTGPGWINGSAAKRIARLSRHRGAAIRSFLVEAGDSGALAGGQAGKARAWGAELASDREHRPGESGDAVPE
ncbi:flavodoxin [Actinomyces timonensis]|uniref:Flavodoxin n=1 Tax=Actinomyces timonensis TaxID=1288391 RepID=A0AAU8N0Z8_9ACTO